MQQSVHVQRVGVVLPLSFDNSLVAKSNLPHQLSLMLSTPVFVSSTLLDLETVSGGDTEKNCFHHRVCWH